MTLARMPDTMAGYLTHELAEALAKLTAPQRAGIARIVEHHYVQNRPLTQLLKGDDRICTEQLYYRRGKVDPDTGEARNVGWSHQADFDAALKMAARLALQQRAGEELHAVQRAVRKARLESEGMVTNLVDIATGEADDRDRIAASKHVLDIAIKNTEFGDRETDGDMADDWWKAAEE